MILLAGGVFFFSVGALGLVRLPDVFSRMHATAKSDTLGAGLILTAFIVHYGLASTSLRVVAIILFIAISTPVATHLIARAVFRSRAGSTTWPHLDPDPPAGSGSKTGHSSGEDR
jgi:multicomponent Na+:H+ antiporter subunit G